MLITIQGKELTVTVKRKRMKNIVLRLDNDGNVTISCPPHVSEERIYAFLKEKETWIIQARNRQMQKQEKVKTGIDGISATWMGKEYPVKFVEAKRNAMSFENGVIVFHVKDRSAETIEKTFYHEANKYLLYLIQQEREFLDEHICKMNQKPLPRIRIKYMTSRWGSCTPAKSNISISSRLIHFPHECFSYVLLHEYAHILVANHSKDFYAVVKTYMPDYKKYSDYLNH
ncbi:MAG: SprT family zinc-dependent metalloprotease [Bulleidia sp.]|jgi:predicted metal-dependent hydrolase|nr:SprT family zinc-dependent metalloprotease [Bulleidia sp.]